MNQWFPLLFLNIFHHREDARSSHAHLTNFLLSFFRSVQLGKYLFNYISWPLGAEQ